MLLALDAINVDLATEKAASIRWIAPEIADIAERVRDALRRIAC